MTTPDKPQRCRAVKRGKVDLTCELDFGHATDPESWHEATFTATEKISYPGARHQVATTEHVAWEPVDEVAEAVKHLMRGKRP